MLREGGHDRNRVGSKSDALMEVNVQPNPFQDASPKSTTTKAMPKVAGSSVTVYLPIGWWCQEMACSSIQHYAAHGDRGKGSQCRRLVLLGPLNRYVEARGACE